MEKNPLPQYASTRCVGGLIVEDVSLSDITETSAELDGENIASLAYMTRDNNIELLFWKKEPPGNSNSMSPTRSLTMALWSVTQTCSSTADNVSISTMSECEADSDVLDCFGMIKESLRRRLTPFLYVCMLLL